MKKKTMLHGLAVAAVLASGLMVADAAYASDAECVPSQGNQAVFGDWAWDSYTQWQPANTTPSDPDGQSGEDNLANEVQIGEGYNDTLDAAYRQPVRDELLRVTDLQVSDVPPAVGANEELGDRHEVEVGNGDGTEDTVVFDHWQRYSLNGKYKNDFDQNNQPPSPSENPDMWTDNVKGDPHGQGAAGAYYRSNDNSGNGDWFYLEAVTKTVKGQQETTHLEYQWDVYAFHYEYRWSVYERTNTEGTDPVTCDDEELPPTDGGETPGDETPGDETPGTPPTDTPDTNTPAVPTEVKGQTAQTPSSAPSAPHAANQPTQSQTTGHNPAAVPLSIDAGL